MDKISVTTIHVINGKEFMDDTNNTTNDFAQNNGSNDIGGPTMASSSDPDNTGMIDQVDPGVLGVSAVNVGNSGIGDAQGDQTTGFTQGENDINAPHDTTNATDIGLNFSDKEGDMTARNVGDFDTGDDTTGRLDNTF